MKPAFILTARNKEKYVARAVCGALRQTVPCEILLSDQLSTDRTLEAIRSAVKAFGPTHHDVKIVECPIGGPMSMRGLNDHIDWLWRQASSECDWFFQCSADDESLPDRFKVCMEAVENNPCSAVACTMFTEFPDRPTQWSGYPKESGYVKAGEGLTNLAYGSTIGAYSREFLTKVSGVCGPNTPDVLLGWLAALDKGFYVVVNHQHIRVMYDDPDNIGFDGKLLTATLSDAGENERLILQEQNVFQLTRLYMACIDSPATVFPEIAAAFPREAFEACVDMILSHLYMLIETRQALSDKNLQPGVLK